MINIVLADDEPITRQGLALLDWAGEDFNVVGVAAHGVEALQLVRKWKPDLLLTDIRMPGLGGLELMQVAIREQPNLKVVFLTAHHQLNYALEAITLGAVGFVLKPTEPEEIMKECRKAQRLIAMERSRSSQEEGMREQLKEYAMTLHEKIMPQSDAEALHAVVRVMLDHMEQHYMNNITIDSLAKMHHFNPDYLSRLFKKETGDTFVNTLTRMRMQKAVSLLGDNQMKVYEVAEKVGIRDTRYFGQMFKKRYGVKPNEFRKQIIYSDIHKEGS
jgi:two-component system response regulator YesN